MPGSRTKLPTGALFGLILLASVIPSDPPDPLRLETAKQLGDYFLGGWYFREGTFIGPLHGVPVKDALNASVAMYRVHERDAVHFLKRFRMAFVNPWEPDRLKPFAWSSVAFAYLDTPDGAGPELPGREELLCWYRRRNTDHQSIP